MRHDKLGTGDSDEAGAQRTRAELGRTLAARDLDGGERRLALYKVCPTGKSEFAVKPYLRKYSACRVGQISATSSPRPCPARGAVPRRHKHGEGGGGRGNVGAQAGSLGSSSLGNGSSLAERRPSP